jgi:hypothetical protein
MRRAVDDPHRVLDARIPPLQVGDKELHAGQPGRPLRLGGAALVEQPDASKYGVFYAA